MTGLGLGIQLRGAPCKDIGKDRLKSLSSAWDDDASNLSNVTGEFFCTLGIAGDNISRDKQRSHMNNTIYSGYAITYLVYIGKHGWLENRCLQLMEVKLQIQLVDRKSQICFSKALQRGIQKSTP